MLACTTLHCRHPCRTKRAAEPAFNPCQVCSLLWVNSSAEAGTEVYQELHQHVLSALRGRLQALAGFSQNIRNRECSCQILMNMFSYHTWSAILFSKAWLVWSKVFLDSKKAHTFHIAISPTKYQALPPKYMHKGFLVSFWATFFAFRERKRQPVPGINPEKFTSNQVKPGKIISNWTSSSDRKY